MTDPLDKDVVLWYMDAAILCVLISSAFFIVGVAALELSFTLIGTWLLCWTATAFSVYLAIIWSLLNQSAWLCNALN